jgi:hypothetical protein
MRWFEILAVEQPNHRSTWRIHFVAQLSVQNSALARKRLWYWLGSQTLD